MHTFHQEGCAINYDPVAAVAAGVAVPLGPRLGISKRPIPAGGPGALHPTGYFWMDKAAIQLIEGQEAYLIPASNTVGLYAPGRYYAGLIAADAAPSDTRVLVAVNVFGRPTIDIRRGTWTDTVVGNATALPKVGGGGKLTFTSDAEAQKASFVSEGTISIAAHPIFEARIARGSASASAIDIDIGLATADQAVDFEAGTVYAAFHNDGGDANIDVHSKGGDADRAIADTNVDLTDGTYLILVIDARDRADVRFFIDGVRVKDDVVYSLPATATALKAIAMIEKTSNAATGSLSIDRILVWPTAA